MQSAQLPSRAVTLNTVNGVHQQHKGAPVGRVRKKRGISKSGGPLSQGIVRLAFARVFTQEQAFGNMGAAISRGVDL